MPRTGHDQCTLLRLEACQGRHHLHTSANSQHRQISLGRKFNQFFSIAVAIGQEAHVVASEIKSALGVEGFKPAPKFINGFSALGASPSPWLIGLETGDGNESGCPSGRARQLLVEGIDAPCGTIGIMIDDLYD